MSKINKVSVDVFSIALQNGNNKKKSETLKSDF